MTTDDARNLAIVAVVAVAPLALILIFAILRSYTITVHMTRKDHRRRSDDDED